MDGTTTTASDSSGEQQRATDARGGEPQLLATAVGDQCANCGARLAGDQRYCLECGERRGRPRYSPTGIAAGARDAPVSSRRRPWMLSGSGALIGGIGVLLIAMGVGVLIGRTSNGSSPRAAGVQVITVPGGAAAASAPAATTPTTGSRAARTSSKSSTSKSKANAKNPSAALAAKLPPKARVIPKKLQSAVAKPGSKCTASTKGCTNGKFTGTFFGGG